MKVTLISGRTAKQGIGLEEGKLSKNYTESVNHVQICPADAEALKLKKNSNIKLATEHGSVIVRWVPDEGLGSGIVFFPYGPWANQVYAASTSSTGMPIMKGIPATIEPTEEQVFSIEEIVKKLRSGN